MKMKTTVIFALLVALLSGCSGSGGPDGADMFDDDYKVTQSEVDSFTRDEALGVWSYALYYAEERAEELNDSETRGYTTYANVEDLRQTMAEDYLCSEEGLEGSYCYLRSESPDKFTMKWDGDSSNKFLTTVSFGEGWISVSTEGPLQSAYCLRAEPGAKWQDEESGTVFEDITVTSGVCSEE
jgi:hypothetical protein